VERHTRDGGGETHERQRQRDSGVETGVRGMDIGKRRRGTDIGKETEGNGYRERDGGERI
jgi:hypothetical protein